MENKTFTHAVCEEIDFNGSEKEAHMSGKIGKSESSLNLVGETNELEPNTDGDTTLETIDITPEKSGGVLKQVVKEGEGDEYPGYGDKVSVHYTGWLLSNREKPVIFDSNRKEEKCHFNVGRGQVIKGWDLGISTMKKGEIAIFIVQPEYAYGAMGYLPTIPPHTTLLFEVELYEWKLEDLSPRKDNGILRKVIDKGEASSCPNDGSLVKVKLVGYFQNKVFEDSKKEFILGEGCNSDIPEGIELALLKFHLKEKSLLYLKSKYAFEKGFEENNIPPDADIQYELTLLEFEKAKDIWEMDSDEKLEKAKICKEKGIAFVQAGLYKVALKQFKWIQVCLENEPGSQFNSGEARKALLLSGYLNMALCYLKLENYTDTIKASDKALEIDSKNEKALFRRGQAKMLNNDCKEALEDFEALYRLYPENKASKQNIILCHEKIKEQNQKDKCVYSKMFEKFVKQDEERLKNMKTETGVWLDKQEKKTSIMNLNQRLYEQHNAVLQDANIIELSNTAC